MSLFGGSKGKAKATEPDRLGSIKIQSQGYGNVVPLVFGTTRLAPTLFFYANFFAWPVEENSQSAGKGGGKKKKTLTGYNYSASVMMGICRNHINGTGKLWVDKKIYPSLTGTWLTAANGSIDAPPSFNPVHFRGFAYLHAWYYPLSDNATLGNHTLEVWGECTDGVAQDANPAVFIPYLLINECGMAAERLGDMTAYNNHCNTNGLLFSFALTTQQQASELIEHYLLLTGAELAKRNSKITIIHYGAAGLDSGYALNSDDFIVADDEAPIIPTRKKAIDVHNAVKIEYLNRATDYNIDIAEAKDMASIESIGLRPADTLTAHGIVTAQLAANVANYLLQKDIATRNSYEFTLSLRYIRLEPMDVVTLTDSVLGLINAPVIIKKIVITPEWLLKITAEDYLHSRSSSNYPAVTSTPYIPDDTTPVGDINPPIIFAAPESLTATGYELWCAISSNDALYGGCEVHISVDGGASYSLIGAHSGETRMGVLTAALASASGLDITHTLSADLSVSTGELSTVSQAAFDNNETLCRVNNEFLSYRDVNLTAPSTYDITHLQRGLYGSTTGAASGDDFVRCDKTLFRYTYDPIYKGKTIKLKFVAYNSFGESLQDIADVPFYSFTIPSTTATTNASAPTTTSLGALITSADTLTAPAQTDTVAMVDSTTGELTQVALKDLIDPYAFVECARTITGTTPLLVAEFTLPAGTYTGFTAVIGTSNSTTIATLDIKNPAGTVLKTLTRTGTPLQVATTGFTLASDTLVGFYLRGDLSTTEAFVFSLGVK